MAVPIWKDYIVELNGTYRIIIADTQEVVYSGYAVAKPGETYAHVRINDVCADWLENVLPNLSQAEFTELNLPVTFKVQMIVPAAGGNQWVDLYTIQFLNDWSYDYGYDPATMGMSFPINGLIDSRMPLVWTGLDVSQVNMTIHYRNGTTAQVFIPIAISDDFNADFNSDFSRSVRSAGSGTAVFLLSEWDDVESVTIGSSTFRVVTDCAKYALYYVNAHGGWDCLCILGNTIEADTLKRFTREMVYDNRDIQNRGIQNYVNEITKGFTFHTGWLLADQGERMHHLINSTDVYLYDIANEQMIPVIVTDNSCEYKTFKNQGNRLVDYTIQVEVAQHRERR